MFEGIIAENFPNVGRKQPLKSRKHRESQVDYTKEEHAKTLINQTDIN